MCLIATYDESFSYNKRISRRKRRLLDGICPEVADLLKDRHCPIDTF